jgi:hypothetical protein
MFTAVENLELRSMLVIFGEPLERIPTFQLKRV